MAELLEVRNLSVSFPGYGKTIHDVSLIIDEQECCGILGYSGAGKSLTAWAVTGVLPGRPQVEGQIFLRAQNGQQQNLMADPGARRIALSRDIGVIPQNPFTSLNPAMTCGKQIEEVLKDIQPDRTMRRNQVMSALSDLTFEEPERIYTAFPHELSGGQLQRVVMAMATVTNPRLLIADEPTTALDTVTQDAVLTWMFGWASRTGASVLFVSHDLAFLRRYCDLIYIMEEGRLTAHV
ncbi:MAG: ATP-binding cassette domain-containing protein [Saprospiraceae bacterium]|nr:ATP-binding cassette domain-containing protein [Saprospiraceae bacterium]